MRPEEFSIYGAAQRTLSQFSWVDVALTTAWPPPGTRGRCAAAFLA